MMSKGQLTIKINDADIRTVRFDNFVIFSSFSVDSDSGTSTDVIPNNDGRFRLISTNCLYFPQYNAICVLDSPLYVKMFDGQQYKVQLGILRLWYAGKSGYSSNHNELLYDFDYETLYSKEVVANIQKQFQFQYGGLDQMYVCILEISSHCHVTFGIDGDNSIEYEIIRLLDVSTERISQVGSDYTEEYKFTKYRFNTVVLNGLYGRNWLREKPQKTSDVTLDPGLYLLIVRQEEDWAGAGVTLYWKYQEDTTWRIFGLDNAPGNVYTWIPDDNYVKTFEFIKTAGLDQKEPIVSYLSTSAFIPAYVTVTNVGCLITINDVTYKSFFTNLPSIFNEQLYAEPKNVILIQDTLENKIQGFFVLSDGETLW